MKSKIMFIVGLLVAVMAFGVSAQDDMMMMEPMVAVSDQVSLDGMVTVDTVVSAGPGWIVIHADNGGAPGPVIGQRAVNVGTSEGVSVEIDTTMATPVLYAMLHEDTGEAGVYEFGMVEGADGPVADADGNVITPAFNVELARAYDQFVEMNTITMAAVAVSQDGFVVVHAAADGAPGPVLGFTPVTAGTNTDVAVELEGEITDTVFPMLHVDTGEAGVYEFGTVEGADGPVAVNGTVATFPITVGTPAMRVNNQIVDGTVVAESVLSDGPGWLVIHADNGGAPGPVLGFAAVENGVNTNVEVELMEAATPVLFPMLHVDTGEVGTYEFGQVEGADGPVMVDGGVLVYPIDAAPSITYSGTISENTVTVDAAQIDAQGWLVIHADNGGAPGPVLGQTPLVAGVSENVAVALEGDITETVFPMLHYDTGEMGVYEFGAVEGADGPVAVNDAVVTGPLTPEAGM